MKTLKVMGIVGLCLSLLSWICMASWMNPVDYESAIGWGFILMFYTIALCIVCIVQGSKKNK
jgi:hypothetical protein